MTQHLLQEHSDEDRQTMRRLATVIGAFVVATIVLALGVGLVMN
jgi:hypothetical protein